MRKIAIMNNKGGVAKTITALNLADILVRDYKKRVLLVDGDGQMNLTRFYLPGFDPEVQCTVASVLAGEHEAVWSDNLVPISPGLDLLPGSSALYDLDLRAILGGEPRTMALQHFCEAVEGDGTVDFIIFDCPPGYTVASVSALTAADEVVIPMLVDGFSFIGALDMEKQLRSLQSVKSGSRIAGILITQWRRRSAVVQQGEELLREVTANVFQTVIRHTDKVPESTFERLPLAVYSPGSAAAQDYRKWVREYLGEAL